MSAAGKTDMEIAEEGLVEMESWMRKIGLVMNIKDLGVTESMIEGIVKSTLIMQGGYKVLTSDDVRKIVKESFKK